mgnify:CR=1 FL=1
MKIVWIAGIAINVALTVFNASIGNIWEATDRPGRMVKVVEVLPNTVYFENLRSGATFPRPKDNFLDLYESRREDEEVTQVEA